MLERPREGDLVDATADEQVAGQGACRRMLDHLVDLQLVVLGTRLEEEVVGQILDEVARGEDVVPCPGPAERVLGQGSLAACDEVPRAGRRADEPRLGSRGIGVSSPPSSCRSLIAGHSELMTEP